MSHNELDQLIHAAVKKVGGNKENDICHYLPGTMGEWYIHHFTMRKMKTEDPQQLAELLTKFIINSSNPQEVIPKPRAARGSRKRRDLYTFSKQDLERMLSMARTAGDKEMVRKLTPKKDLRTIKRELISSIRHGRIEPELWNMYCEAMASQASLTAPLSAAVAV